MYNTRVAYTIIIIASIHNYSSPASREPWCELGISGTWTELLIGLLTGVGRTREYAKISLLLRSSAPADDVRRMMVVPNPKRKEDKRKTVAHGGQNLHSRPVVLASIDEILAKEALPFWTHPLLIPSYLALFSIVVLLTQAIFSSGPVRRLRDEDAPVIAARGESGVTASVTREGFVSAVKDHVEKSGGSIILLFQVLRLVIVLTLLGLAIFSSVQEEGQQHISPSSAVSALDHWGRRHEGKHRYGGRSLTEREWLDLTLCLTYLYAAFLGLMTLTARRVRASVASFHLSSLLLGTFSVYAYRNIWPLLTFTLSPVDAREGALLWVRIGLLAFVAIVIPLLVPYQYIPIDPKANYDYTRNLVQRSFKAALGYIFWRTQETHFLGIYGGLPSVLRREYIQLAIFVVIKVFSTLMAPVGMNQLLRYPFFVTVVSYLETCGEGAVVRPWVWVTYLFLGPALGTIAFQWYIFIATGTLVRVTAIVTQLVFEHALRIRVKAEASSSPAATPDATPEVRSEATTPDSGSVIEINIVSEEAGGNSEETRSEQSTIAGSSIKGKQKEEAPGSDSGRESDDEPGDSSNLVGKMNNLVSADLENIIDGRDFLLLSLSFSLIPALCPRGSSLLTKTFSVLYSPLQIVICVWFLYNILGWSAFVGMVVMVALFPIPGTVAGKIQKIQRETAKRTDARVQAATESEVADTTMGILRMIKLFGWEPKIDARLAEKREQELQYIKLRQILIVINGNINFFIPVITMVVTYVTYTAIMKRALTRNFVFLSGRRPVLNLSAASAVFSSMAAFDLIRDQLQSVFWMIPTFIRARVSLDRVNDFLHHTELLDQFADVEKGSKRVMPTDASHFDKGVIGFQNASFTWSNDHADGTLTPSRRRFTLRVHGELLFKRGCFNLIIGPTGSGKTSLLMALLGEMHFVPISPDSWYHLPRQGGVSYAAQESWVQNETIRSRLHILVLSEEQDNILFGAAYDEERYNKVIYQCGLQHDLSLFDAGDKTEVGEKGLTLSGGQKARVTLARAVYSSSQILILDDVLAALDVHTARWIVEKCFKGDLIRGRTILLVTHNIAMASPLADYVVLLGKDGRIASRGSISDALKKDKALEKELPESIRVIEDNEKNIDLEEPNETAKSADGKLILAEEIAEGNVSWDAVYAAGMLLFSTLMTVQTWFMGYWAEQYDIYPPDQVNITFYLIVYGLILLMATGSYTAGFAVYTFGALRASRTIHRILIDSVLSTSLRWLDTTPTSRIITRVTQDIRARGKHILHNPLSLVDGPLPDTFFWVVDISAGMLLKFVAVVYFTPVFSVPGIAIAVLGGWLGRVYMKAQIAIKREMSNAKAARARPLWRRPSPDSYPSGHMALSLRSAKSRTGGSISGLFAASLAAYLIYVPNERSLPSDTGFSLTMARFLVGFSGLILWWATGEAFFKVREETLIGAVYSLERIHSYINAEQEPKPTEQGIPPAYWPASGDLRVENLSARYSHDGPKVLHDISFHIKPGERVGVEQSAAREAASVYYDGRLTSSINLDALRSSITIIPQVPELLSGSLRENIDPFSQYDDATLNSALHASGLFSLQSDDEDGRLALDSHIASGGGNLSVGQRQILALARAIVRGSKLLILDEATSAIDYKTDTIIQTSLRTELKGDVTLITVAHRLQTIIDADKVMVLDAGRIVEFDKPSELLKLENGRFRSLVDESGDRELLYSIASSAGKAQH
ncbi:hypothetical protein EDB86DRAFT_2828663 [Lactarius hatsudake]|nr:hypothetical protein EDB86DRAFT_2828663 [Lactarius hatsudake]